MGAAVHEDGLFQEEKVPEEVQGHIEVEVRNHACCTEIQPRAAEEIPNHGVVDGPVAVVLSYEVHFIRSLLEEVLEKRRGGCGRRAWDSREEVGATEG